MLLIFPIAITIHNIEEAIFMPKWLFKANKFRKRRVDAFEFRFAVCVITLVAYFVTGMMLWHSEMPLIRLLYYSFMGAMTINALVPHLAVTIASRRYMPGVVSGTIIILPGFSIVLYHAIERQLINGMLLAVASMLVGIVLLVALPLLFRFAAVLRRRFAK
jgi:hypothetical protein